MARLSLRLPETLHQRLTSQARQEGVSLNQYLVYLLAQFSAPLDYRVKIEESQGEQRRRFEALRADLGSASEDELRQILDQREPRDPDPDLTPELQDQLARTLARARETSSH